MGSSSDTNSVWKGSGQTFPLKLNPGIGCIVAASRTVCNDGQNEPSSSKNPPTVATPFEISNRIVFFPNALRGLYVRASLPRLSSIRMVSVVSIEFVLWGERKFLACGCATLRLVPALVVAVDVGARSAETGWVQTKPAAHAAALLRLAAALL
jgi:hypothetical protein